MAIDTVKVARRLRDAGFSEPQAEAVVAAVQDGAEGADLTTKRDLVEAAMESKRDLAEAVGQLRSEMREMGLRLKLEIKSAARHTESRLVGMILGALGINLLGTLGAMFGLAELLGH